MLNKKRILTILGTRPEIIRLSRIIPKLDKTTKHHILHTGQNYDPNLNSIFFKELGLRKPDTILESSGTLAEQLSITFKGVEDCVNKFNPDAVLVLGDTNSGLSSVICERMGIPVYHMEAGNRCFDLKVPEEKNRKVIDAISSFNLAYTNGSQDNLVREGQSLDRALVIGNPIKEVIDYYEQEINDSKILKKLKLYPNRYIIATAHRAENVDDSDRLKNIFAAFEIISAEYPIVFSCHPRTAQKLKDFNVSTNNIIVTEPLGFFDFVNLEKNSFMAITDSGTVQEEMCLFNIPTVTIRDTTERPETVKCGSNKVTGLSVEGIVQGYWTMKSRGRGWIVPEEYLRNSVSDTVLQLLLDN